jgi:predicted anti-sigma-YlaC factor YlaD
LISATHIEDHNLDLYVREKLDAEQSSNIQTHVQNCSLCRDRLVNGFLTRLGEMNQERPENGSNEKRAARRFQSGERGTMQTLCPLSLERAAVQIVDVSKDGFGVVVDSLLATGTIVQIQIGTTISVGTVRSCRATGDQQFHAGIHVRTHMK